MRKIILFLCVTILLLSSCASVRVETDHDSRADFSNIKTFAFYKEGIDAVKLSDLDKKRILRFIEEEMLQKGFVLSQTPDVFINFFTKERHNYATAYSSIGWGWGPFYTGTSIVQPHREGVLYIDIINAKEKDLIWQGKGIGTLSQGSDKEQRIEKFVKSILSKFPPKKQ